MQRHHRDRDMLWLTSGLPFLTWATDSAARAERQAASNFGARRPDDSEDHAARHRGEDPGRSVSPDRSRCAG